MIDEYPIVIAPLPEEDGGGFIGFVPDLPGCMSDGETREEALKNTEVAILDWAEAQIEMSLEMPSPGSAAERADKRDKAFRETIAVLLEDNDNEERDIQLLRQKLASLIKSLESDGGQRKMSVNVPASLRPSKPQQTH